MPWASSTWARDPLIGRELALKTFRLGYSAGDRELEQFRVRFLREAQSAGILSASQHRHHPRCGGR